MKAASKEVLKREFLGHPVGLFILFLTEMWERFSFYGMRALLVLFLVDNVRGGLGWTKENALQLYGVYTMAVYIFSIIGGALADKWMGKKLAVLYGAFLACVGHFLLALQHEGLFMLGLCFIAGGTSLLKPNISALVGSLYPIGDKRRDGGFTIFYMGVNIGAVLAGLIIGGIGQNYGWHYGFGVAGIGMLLGIGILVIGKKYLADVGNVVKKSIVSRTNQNIKKSIIAQLTKKEKDRLLALVISFIAIISFFVAFEQAGGLMNLYTEQYTDRYVFGKEIPASVFQSLNPFFVILLGPVVAIIWNYLTKRNHNISTFYKLGIGNIIVGIGFLFMIGAAMQLKRLDVTHSSLYWIIGAYLFHTIGELCISPVSLSFVSKLAPERMGASIMGIYFAVVGLGNYFAAWLGKQSAQMGDLSVFQVIFWTSVTVGFLFVVLSKRLAELSHNAE